MMFDYAAFEPGSTYGEHDFAVTAEEVAAWRSLFGGAGAEWMPAGMVPVVAMRAYMAVVTPRPPGNVHGASTFRVYRRVRVGETLRTTVGCEGKDIRKGRKIVRLGLHCRGATGDVAFDATITSLVAV
jgi:hypothetical protein